MKNKTKKVAIIGHFGGQENFLDGQTVKTKILYDELKNATDWDIKKVDTYYFKRNTLRLLWQSLLALLTRKDIFILLSRNGMKVYFPMMYAASKILKTRVYHDVIGGDLDGFIKKHPRSCKYINSFRVNWVETAAMKASLQQIGITNAEILPNFKRLNYLKEYELKGAIEAPFRFCTFSRVMKEKGIEDAIAAIESINADAGWELCTLDIFGSVDAGYKTDFEALMQKTTPAIRYGGLIPFDKSVEAIKDYFALLFPTYWKGEGFPGTIVDAFSAGLPVIATDWNCNAEIIENGKTGYIYASAFAKDLKSAVLNLINEKEKIPVLKRNCIKAAKKYQPEEHVKTIIDLVNRKRR